jgi:acetoin utilization deacetylase AcuC-like enzyme
VPSLGVGLAYDEAFLLHRCAGHVERPARLESIRRALSERGLWSRLRAVLCRAATDEELERVHTKGYVRKLERALGGAGGADAQALKQLNADSEDVYFNEHTLHCARLAAGSCVEAVSCVAGPAARCRSAVAIVRPPGHHSERHCAQGFCVFNNVAVAARHATEALGLRRVLIVDWDVHHGNGTQQCFYADARVLYVSVHRYDLGRFYPGSQAGAAASVGAGAGCGFNVNVAWNGKGMGDCEYLAAWQRVLVPLARQFAPQLVLLSAGFDAAAGDDMGQCDVSPLGFAVLLRHLLGLADGRLVMALEGGYHLPSLASSVAACVDLLLSRERGLEPCAGEEPGAGGDAELEARLDAYEAELHAQAPKQAALHAIDETLEAHRRFWTALR